MRIHLALPATIALALALGACGTETVSPTQAASSALRQDRGTVYCGGIAGFICPEGQRCIMKDSDPDAMGVCVGRPEHDAWSRRCDGLIACTRMACPYGTTRLYTPGNCCGICVPDHDLDEGQCRTVADCSDLIHIMCVGSWSCDAGWCNYSCDGGEILEIQ